MFCEWAGKTTKLYRDNRQLWRVFNTSSNVQCAYVSGEDNEARVSITLANGRTLLYRGNGQLLRG